MLFKDYHKIETLGMLVMVEADKEIDMELVLKSVIRNQGELDTQKLKKMRVMFVQEYNINMD